MGNVFAASSVTNYTPVSKKCGVATLDNQREFPEYVGKPEFEFDMRDVPHIRNGIVLSYWLNSQDDFSSQPVSQSTFQELLWSLVDSSCEQVRFNYEGVNRNEYFFLQSFHITDEFTNRLATWSLVSCPTLKTVYLVFRGTKSFNDATVDLAVYPITTENPDDPLSNIHMGFYTTLQSIQEDIYEALSKFSQHLNNEVHALYVVGQSEGAALAQVFALAFEKRPHPFYHLIKALTFAAPLLRWVQNVPTDVSFIKSNNTADSSSKKYKIPPHMIQLNGYQFNSKILNFVNNNDMVPTLPFSTKYDIGWKTFTTLIDIRRRWYSFVSLLVDPVLVPFLMENTPDVVLGFRPVGLTVRLVGCKLNQIQAQSLNHDFAWFMKRRYLNDGDHHTYNYVDIVHTYFHR